MNGIMRNTFIRMAAIALVLFCGILFVTLRLENNALAAKADDLKEEAELLRYAAIAESYSTHPIAESIKEAYGSTVDTELISEAEEISGHVLLVIKK